MPEVTIAQLAEKLGVTREGRVSQIKKTGRLEGTYRTEGRFVFFDEDAAIAAWNGEIPQSTTKNRLQGSRDPKLQRVSR